MIKEFELFEELFQCVSPALVAEILFNLKEYDSHLYDTAAYTHNEVSESCWIGSERKEFDDRLKELQTP